ncbi:hypothetical protein F5Y06DRAFT_292584 [Hypoxylon sp. FL0890]|nr:hypothetical protein F5Y06DRAFT_292584 [Hypoxylon sp. FL0890]
MSSPTISPSDSVSRMGSPINDASSVQFTPLTKSAIEGILDGYFQEIKDTLNSMANEFLRLQLPACQSVSARWELQRVVVDATGTIIKPHPFIFASQDGETNCSLDRHIYAPVITIPLPWNMMASDKRVTFLRDALLYDETYEFRGPHGIPFRQHPAYGLFTLEFTNPAVDLGGCTGILWCPSTTVYLPDPNKTCCQDSMEFVLRDTWDQTGMWNWAFQCMKARKDHENMEISEIKKEDEGLGDDVWLGLISEEPENMDFEI